MALKPGKNIIIFKNPYLEKLTYVHPIMPALIWLPVSIYCLLHSINSLGVEKSTAISLFIFGIFFWTFAEYVLHRFVFHFIPHGKFQERLEFLMHGIHHDDPNDQRRLLMPPAAAVILAVILWTIFSIILGGTYIFPFFSGFLIGYLCYDYIHFATHWGKFKSGIFLTLKKNHMDHHFSKDGTLYGVSSPLWDHVFNTFVAKKKRN